MNHRQKMEVVKFVIFCEEHPELRFWQALAAFIKAEKMRLMGLILFIGEASIK